MNSVTVTNNSWASITGTTAGTTASTDGYRIIVTSPAGTETTIAQPLKGSSEKRISPGLYFKFVKSKLNKNEVGKLKERLAKLQGLTKGAFELGQDALYEEYAKMIAVIARESEAAACGFDTWVSVKDIDKFKHIVKEDGGSKSPVYFKKLDEYPRSIPKIPANLIKEVKAKKIFDEYWVLYLDYVGVEVKTNKEKIREKDPIIFGQFAYAKDKYYFITDWVDQHCDLTMQEFVRKLKKDDPEYKVNELDKIDEKFIEKIKAEVMAREQRLAGTKRDNFKDLMKEEDKEKLKEELRKEILSEKSWWRFWK